MEPTIAEYVAHYLTVRYPRLGISQLKNGKVKMEAHFETSHSMHDYPWWEIRKLLFQLDCLVLDDYEFHEDITFKATFSFSALFNANMQEVQAKIKKYLDEEERQLSLYNHLIARLKL